MTLEVARSPRPLAPVSAQQEVTNGLVDELDIGNLPSDFGQAFRGNRHERLHLVLSDVFLVPVRRALFVKGKLDSKVELLGFKGTSSE